MKPGNIKRIPGNLAGKIIEKRLPLSRTKKSYKGFLFNVNRAGAFIETKDSFSLGQIVKLVVPGDGLFKPLNLTGCVVRLEPGGIGISFDKRSGRERRKDIDRRTGADRRDRRRRRGPPK